MKHKGSISQTYLERDRQAIPDLVRQAKRCVEYPTNLNKIFAMAATLPVKSHYIADDSAINYVRNRLYGRTQHFTNSYKQQLYESLYDEVERMMLDYRYKDRSLKDVVAIALTRPAPCIGLAPNGIRKVYTRMKPRRNKT